MPSQQMLTRVHCVTSELKDHLGERIDDGAADEDEDQRHGEVELLLELGGRLLALDRAHEYPLRQDEERHQRQDDPDVFEH